MGDRRIRVGAVAAVIAVLATGCGSVTRGSAVAEPGAVTTSAGSGGGQPVTALPDCATLDRALGAFVAGMTLSKQTTMPGSAAPICLWTDGAPIGVGDNLFAGVKDNGFTAAMIDSMRGRGSLSVVDDPRVTALGGVALRVTDSLATIAMPGRSVDAGTLGRSDDWQHYLDAAVSIAQFLGK
ncbi:hypothetical protein FK531_04415 [Rhodococcus spelaei]|uniref:DUF3558 domain-containing protein n=1 Tax=Rhodococcus spelaei TaxID=2546320 RepID=A0A541BNM1_9NOCA|nr:hypothetical protein [Rhodococcus spelaei]TQF73925.1 hypothetical protein FK531_04415 [Rhodococcus spelaei]